MSLGRRLKKARERAKMSLRKVEEKTGISYSYLSNIENGRRKNPSMEALRTLAGLYDIDITYFIDGPSGYNPQTDEEREIRELLEDDRRVTLLREAESLSDEELDKVIKIIKVLRGKL